MSDTFEKIHVKDDVIGNLTNKVKYAVMTSAQNITAQPFQAISKTPAAHVFNIAVPSLETVIQREVLWASTVTIAITGANKPVGEYLVNYGVTDALSAFPLHSLVQNMTCTINNNTVSMNVADTLAPLLRLLDPEETARYDCLTPTSLDYLGNYRDGVHKLPYTVGYLGNPGAGAAQGTKVPVIYDIIDANHNESLPADPQHNGYTAQTFASYPNNTLAYDMNRPACSTWYHKPRGSWQLLRIWAGNADGTNAHVPLITDTTVYVQFRVIEPLLISPFTFGCQDAKQGIYGIQNMTFQMNMLPNANRAWRSISTAANYTKTATVVSFDESQLFFKFYTPKPSDMLESRNVVPYYEFPIYRSTGFNTVAAAVGNVRADGSYPPGPTLDFVSSSIQLSVIPDKLIIFVRRTNASLTCCDTDNFLTINKISINWNNQSGLLASYTPEQLYQASVASGLNNLTWEEFKGLTISAAGRSVDIRAPSEASEPIGLHGVGAVGNVGGASFYGFKYIPTTGSILVLDFARVIQLSDEYYAPGSLGQFNLSMTVNCTNNQAVDFTSANTELIIMPLLSGCMVNEKGSSSTFVGLLTKADVLDTLQQEPYSHDTVKRLVGGSFLDSLKSGLHWISSKLPHVKTALQHINHPIAETGAKVLGALGYSRHPQDKPKLQDRLM